MGCASLGRVGDSVRIARLFTIVGRSPYEGVAFRMAMPLEAEEAAGFEVPAAWSEEACEALAEICFGEFCVPAELIPVVEGDVPSFLWRRRAAEGAETRLGRETDARQVFDRMAGAWAYQGWRGGYFDTEDDAEAFYDEIRFLLCHQMLAPEAAQFASTGLYWAYGAEGATEGWIVDDRMGVLRRAQPRDLPAHGAAILSAARDGDIAALAPHARLECAIDASALGPKHLSAALRIGAATADAHRTPVQTVLLDANHSEAAAFIGAHARAAQRDAAIATGTHIAARHIEQLGAAVRGRGRKSFDAAQNPALRLALIAAREAGLPDTLVERALRLARQGRSIAEYPTLAFDPDGEDEAVPQARHLLRISGARLDDPAGLNGIALAAWMGPATGVFFAATAQSWNPCAGDGAIRASAADGGHVFLDSTPCPRATINVRSFLRPNGSFDAGRFAHATRLAVAALDITVTLTAHPTEALAEGAWRYRPIGLGIANLGPLLMASGVSYDSAQGRAFASAIAALLGGTAGAASAELADEIGAFPRFEDNREHALRGLRNRMRAAEGAREGYEDLPHPPMPFDAETCPDASLAKAARAAWAEAAALATAHGFRNAQTTSITPMKSSERVMGCDAYGIEPDSGLVKYERLPGGGFKKTVSRNVAPALARLGYPPEKMAALVAHIVGHGTLDGAPGINHPALRARGFTAAALQALEAALPSALDIRYVFNQWTLGEEFCASGLGLSARDLEDYSFDMLKALGFSESEIAAANAYACGAQTLEGTKDVDPAHLAVFDTPQPQGRGNRTLAWSASLRMMAAVQPFLSGGIGRTLVMRADATVEECARALWSAWGLGLKTLLLERESDPISLADSPVRAVEETSPSPVHGSGALRDRLVVIEGGDRPLTTPTATTHPTAPQPTAFAGASQALAIAETARTFALAVSHDQPETCRTDAGADARCPTCGNFAPPGARCGVCGSVHGRR